MKRFRLANIAFVVFLCASNSFASGYTVNVLPRQIAYYQDVVEVDISELMPGDNIEVNHSGSPVWIYRRTQDELDFISKNYTGINDENLNEIVSRIKRGVYSTTSYLSARLKLVDQPELEKSPYRSKKHEYFVFKPTGRLGCMLTQTLPIDVINVPGAWLYDPCFSQTYDLTGQFLNQQGTLYNKDTGELIAPEREVFPRTGIPPHRYTSDKTLIIGVSDISQTPDISIDEEELFAGLTPTEVVRKASAFNDIERVQDAIDKGADVTGSGNMIPNPNVSLALRRAVFFGSAELVELILSNGAVPHEIELDWAKRMRLDRIGELLEAAVDQ
jgi:hypothetical protein